MLFPLFLGKNVHAKQFKNSMTWLNNSMKKNAQLIRGGKVFALFYEEGQGGGLTFWLVGLLRFDPVEGVIHKGRDPQGQCDFWGSALGHE